MESDEVVVYFSPACGACSKLEKTLPLFPKTKFRKVNVLDFKEEAKKDGVRFIPTFIINKNGERILVEGNDIEKLKSLLPN